MMKEESWYKFLVISTIMHVFVMAAFSMSIKKPYKKFDLSSSYSVGLVGDIGGGSGNKGVGLPQSKPIAEPKTPPEKLVSSPKEKKQLTAKHKPAPMKSDQDAVSLFKRKTPPAKASPSKEELSQLEARLRDMKKRTEYLDVSQGRSAPGYERWGGGGGSGSGSGGLPGSGEGGARPLDPASQQYMLGVWEKIKNAWGLPGMSKYSKNLETIVTIRIRKDGRIVDINIEKRSGNRVYDESILRVLRSVDPLPPIPSSLNTDSLEIGFRFLPGELS
ncbi:MAG: TonB family protein [Syntrophorhabdus sp.]|nr:TonB family protein [Syntrophorhabdus sp.]NMC93822.1 TonB family protein [Syntrophorhabdus sp.]